MKNITKYNAAEGKNGNTIFLPFTASRDGYEYTGYGHGRYWSSELTVNTPSEMPQFPLRARL